MLSYYPLTKPRKTRLWQFDSSLFQPGPKAGFLERHVFGPTRSLAKYALYALAFTYPTLLVISGILFGGLVFWTSFAASLGLIFVIIKKAGYSQNFANWDVSNKKFVGLFIAFGLTFAFYMGLIHIGLLTIIIFGLVLALALVLGVWKTSNR